jgi:hypothetical protein
MPKEKNDLFTIILFIRHPIDSQETQAQIF